MPTEEPGASGTPNPDKFRWDEGDLEFELDEQELAAVEAINDPNYDRESVPLTDEKLL